MIATAFTLFFWLLAAHALCDYPLQGDFLAKGKNHKAPIPGVPWYQCLTAHALIQGAAVAMLTGSVRLGIAETVLHGSIDFGKCSGWYNFTDDQLFHVACKILWVALALSAT
jgi:hypothetical protein